MAISNPFHPGASAASPKAMSPRHSLSPLPLLLLLCVACGPAVSVEPKATMKEVDNPLPADAITYGFETPLETWKELGGSGERAVDEDIVITDARAATGKFAGKFRVSPESQVSRGNRAELTYDQGAVEGEESWYAWSFLIPLDHQDVPLEDATGAPNWQVIGQWHQQPDFARGETWDDFSAQGKSVPLAVNYYYFSNADPEYVRVKADPQAAALHGFDPTWNEVPVIALSVGDPPYPAAIAQIQKGEWNRIKLHIRWSQGDAGFVEAWLNDKPLTDGKYFGQNMLNAVSHYFKFGLYRNPTIPYTHEVYYDDVEIY